MIQWVTTGALALALLPFGVRAATEVARPFSGYYNTHQGIRVLGNPISGLQTADGYFAQYFEKGRIEDHSTAERNPAWKFMYGRLTAELIDVGYQAPIGGDTSNLSYAGLQALADPQQRVPAPFPGVDGVVDRSRDQGVFIPVNAALKAGPGHWVLPQFWRYMNRPDLFPGGWLHDLGLPLTEPVRAKVTKAGNAREISVQAFERAVLTHDPQNPAAWQVERDNIGVDYLRVFSAPAQDAAINAAIDKHLAGCRCVAEDLAFTMQIQRIEGKYARAQLRPVEKFTDPGSIFLGKENGTWKVLGGPGTAFPPDFYNSFGIPAGIRLDVVDELERTMIETARAYVQSKTAIKEFTFSLDRIDAGYARLQEGVTLPGTTNPAFIYLKLVDANRWVVLGLGSAFDEHFYHDHGIPAVLRR